MELPPQSQIKERESLIQRPEYLQIKKKEVQKVVKKEETNWYILEAWMWIVLFFVLVYAFDIIGVVQDLHISKVVLYSLFTVTIIFLSFIFIEPLWARILTQKQIDKISPINAVLVFVLPIVWIGILFKPLGILSLLLGFDCMMIVIMWPYAQRVFDVFDKLKLKVGEQKAKNLEKERMQAEEAKEWMGKQQ